MKYRAEGKACRVIFSHPLGLKERKNHGDFFFFHNHIVPLGFPVESHLRQSRATQPAVHAGCCRVSIIHRTLTWTTGSLTCAQMSMHAIAHGGVRAPKKSALKVDSGKKIPCRTGESKLRRRRDGPMLYQLSYISSQVGCYLFTA